MILLTQEFEKQPNPRRRVRSFPPDREPERFQTYRAAFETLHTERDRLAAKLLAQHGGALARLEAACLPSPPLFRQRVERPLHRPRSLLDQRREPRLDVVDRDDRLPHDHPVRESHDAGAGLEACVGDEARREPRVQRADVADGGPCVLGGGGCFES